MVNRKLNVGEIKTIGKLHTLVVFITYLKLTHLCDLGRLWEMKKMKRTLAILTVLSLISTPILAEDLKKLSINDASFAIPWIQTDPTIELSVKVQSRFK